MEPRTQPITVIHMAVMPVFRICSFPRNCRTRKYTVALLLLCGGMLLLQAALSRSIVKIPKYPSNILNLVWTRHKFLQTKEKDPINDAIIEYHNKSCLQGHLGTSLNQTKYEHVICDERRNFDKSYLSLFTTMYFKRNKMTLFKNTIETWSQLQPFVQPILYLTPKDLPMCGDIIKLACKRRWVVAVVPECNKDNYPLLKEMFITAMTLVDAVWYGYGNGDIIFTRDLMDSLEFLRQNPNIGKTALVTGRRADTWIPANYTVKSEDDTSHLTTMNASLHGVYGLDYFITQKDGFNWKEVPQFVVGRPEFDNWLAWSSIKKGVGVDATEAITAIHQAVVGDKESWGKISSSLQYNHKFARRAGIFFRQIGISTCLKYKLVRDKRRHDFVLYKRWLRFPRRRRCIVKKERPVFDYL